VINILIITTCNNFLINWNDIYLKLKQDIHRYL